MLQAAALLHDVGRARGEEKHQKRSFRMIHGLARPLGWTERELGLAAVVARYHRGALPSPRGKNMQRLDLLDRRVALELAGVLRLANALDPREGAAPRLEVNAPDGMLVVHSAGYSPLDRKAEKVAAARHLLETVLKRPVIVRGMRPQSVESAYSGNRQSRTAHSDGRDSERRYSGTPRRRIGSS